MSLPYFNLYPADFEADTSHLSFEEDGAFNRLLRLMWMTPGCSLPDDDAWIMRRMRCDAETFRRVVAPIISEFMKRQNGRVFSPRLMREWKKVDVTSRKRSEAGKKGGRPQSLEKTAKDQKPGFDFDKARLSDTRALPEPEPEPEREEDKTRAELVLVHVQSVSPDRFEAFWKIYPNKAAKAAAKKNWDKAIKAGADPERIIEGARRYAAWLGNGSKTDFRPPPKMAQGWLTDQRWDDADLWQVQQSNEPWRGQVYR